jgi:hypothetical protein
LTERPEIFMLPKIDVKTSRLRFMSKSLKAPSKLEVMKNHKRRSTRCRESKNTFKRNQTSLVKSTTEEIRVFSN